MVTRRTVRRHTIRAILEQMRHDGCGGRAGKAELLTGIKKQGPEPDNLLAGAVAIRSPVMPQWVGIHVFPCCDQQDADGGPSSAITGWVSPARHVKQLSRVGSS